MDRELIQDYLEGKGMKEAQAEALSRILSEMATKQDLLLLKGEVEKNLETLKADLTWRMIAMAVFLATVMTLLNLFV